MYILPIAFFRWDGMKKLFVQFKLWKLVWTALKLAISMIKRGYTMSMNRQIQTNTVKLVSHFVSSSSKMPPFCVSFSKHIITLNPSIKLNQCAILFSPYPILSVWLGCFYVRTFFLIKIPWGLSCFPRWRKWSRYCLWTRADRELQRRDRYQSTAVKRTWRQLHPALLIQLL